MIYFFKHATVGIAREEEEEEEEKKRRGAHVCLKSQSMLELTCYPLFKVNSNETGFAAFGLEEEVCSQSVDQSCKQPNNYPNL